MSATMFREQLSQLAAEYERLYDSHSSLESHVMMFTPERPGMASHGMNGETDFFKDEWSDLKVEKEPPACSIGIRRDLKITSMKACSQSEYLRAALEPGPCILNSIELKFPDDKATDGDAKQDSDSSSDDAGSNASRVRAGRPSFLLTEDKSCLTCPDRWQKLSEELLHMQEHLCTVLDSAWRAMGEKSRDAGNFASVLGRELANSAEGAMDARLTHVDEITHAVEEPRKWRWYGVIDPSSPKKMSWDIAIMFIFTYEMMIFPLQAFDLPQAFLDVRPFLEYITTIVWTLDLFISFNTSYYTKECHIETDRAKVTKNYLKSYFLPDLVIVSTDWFNVVLEQDSSESSFNLIRTVLRGSRVVRLFRLRKVGQFIQDFFGEVASESMIAATRILKVLTMIAIVSHYVACAWYALSKLDDVSDNWRRAFLHENPELEGKLPMAYAYATSLHWALSQFTPASMEVFPQNTYERIFVCLVILMALVMFSSFISIITESLRHLRHLQSEKNEQESAIRKYCIQHNLSGELAHRLWRFVKMHKLTSRRRIKEHEVVIFNVLPHGLKTEMRVESYAPTLFNHPMFFRYLRSDYDLTGQICNEALYARSLVAGTEVFHDRQNLGEMVFVMSGRLEYIDEHYHSKEYVNPGGWACEPVLWAEAAILHGILAASDEGSELLMVKRHEFQTVCMRHRTSIGFLVSYAERFIKRFAEASHNEDYDSVLFNDPWLIEGLVIDASSQHVGFFKESMSAGKEPSPNVNTQVSDERLRSIRGYGNGNEVGNSGGADTRLSKLMGSGTSRPSKK